MRKTHEHENTKVKGLEVETNDIKNLASLSCLKSLSKWIPKLE